MENLYTLPVRERPQTPIRPRTYRERTRLPAWLGEPFTVPRSQTMLDSPTLWREMALMQTFGEAHVRKTIETHTPLEPFLEDADLILRRFTSSDGTSDQMTEQHALRTFFWYGVTSVCERTNGSLGRLITHAGSRLQRELVHLLLLSDSTTRCRLYHYPAHQNGIGWRRNWNGAHAVVRTIRTVYRLEREMILPSTYTDIYFATDLIIPVENHRLMCLQVKSNGYYPSVASRVRGSDSDPVARKASHAIRRLADRAGRPCTPILLRLGFDRRTRPWQFRRNANIEALLQPHLQRDCLSAS